MWLLQIIFFLLSFPVIAETQIQTSIHKIDYGRSGDEILVLLDSGHVVKLRDDKMQLTLSQINPDDKSLWNVTIDKNRYLTNITPAGSSVPPESMQLMDSRYEPTIVDGNGLAKKYFWGSRISHGETQCFNRAHVWAYELWKNYKVKSQKLFLFFTLKFIREHDYGWWFHVAPLLIVDQWLGKSEKVIDPKYINSPRSIDWWLGKFLSNGNCQFITKYSDYADFPYLENCYLLKAPMYTYQPVDLEIEEVWGVKKTDFVTEDLQWAYKEAFQMEYSGND